MSMLRHMRTTVRLDDSLSRQIKRLAAEEQTTFTALLEQALREMLQARKGRGDGKRVPLPTFKGQGLQPGVDLDDSAALLELMEGSDEAL